MCTFALKHFARKNRRVIGPNQTRHIMLRRRFCKSVCHIRRIRKLTYHQTIFIFHMIALAVVSSHCFWVWHQTSAKWDRIMLRLGRRRRQRCTWPSTTLQWHFDLQHIRSGWSDTSHARGKHVSDPTSPGALVQNDPGTSSQTGGGNNQRHRTTASRTSRQKQQCRMYTR